ncbi:MAG: hypothetical protein HY097_04235 [Nitrospinae bacterium]|nr:hypothetical protein [Nitrospinota bacterium]MBI3813216.1 hypothetical protein [Nitrospinota bacterium]
MQKSKKEIEPIPDEFKTIIEASDFWDTHDASDYWDKTKKAKFRVSLKKEPKYIILVYIEGAGGCAGVAEYCREA